jgi:hypothetical protein
MTTITVVMQEEGYPDVLISVDVANPQDQEEVRAAVQVERNNDLEDAANPVTVLFAFAGDLHPIADWRE